MRGRLLNFKDHADISATAGQGTYITVFKRITSVNKLSNLLEVILHHTPGGQSR